MLTRLAVLSLSFSLSSCGGPVPQTSSVEGLSADGDADNVALLFETNVSAARNDVRRLQTILGDESADYNYDVSYQFSATKYQITEQVRQKAPLVSEEGTLFLFLAGHGSRNGYLSTPSGFLNYEDIETALREARETPFRRFVIVVFSCYAGNWVDGPYPVEPRPDEETLAAGQIDFDTFDVQAAQQDTVNQIIAALQPSVAANGEPLFEEMLVWASSRKDRQSWFNGNGSMFIQEFERIYNDKKRARDEEGASPSMGEFVEAVNNATDGRTERPVYRMLPDEMSAEGLFN